MSEHLHVGKVLEWKLDEKTNQVPALYGCTGCDETFNKAPKNQFTKEHTHTEYVNDCFACKVETLQLSTGDANSNVVASGWTGKRWNKELDMYKEARKQGIQPDGTSMSKVQKALDISDKTGVAYGS